jgi:aminopeptidase N
VPPSEATPDNVWRIFNGRLSYDKGASIIHVLRHELNDDDLFFEVLNTYQEVFTDSTATGDDFRMILEQVTEMDFEQFFDQWYYGQGYPRYDIEYYMFENTFNMYVTQTTSSITPLFQMTMDYKLTFSDNSDTTVRLFQESNVEHFALDLGKQVIDVQVDPDNWTFERVNSIVVGTNSELKSEYYFSAYPNPVSDHINIVFAQEQQQSTAILRNSAGQVLLSQSLNAMHNQLDMRELPKGIYFLTVSNENNNFTRKLVK